MLDTPRATPESEQAAAAIALGIQEAQIHLAQGALLPEVYREALRQRAEQTAEYGVLSMMLEVHDPGVEAGPLSGIPVLVKDSIDVQGAASAAGTPALGENIAPMNAPIVQRLLDAGAWITGKTVMHELALGVTSNNAYHGTPKNPWDGRMISGGSSGGAAAALALGLAPASIGTDTGGSVRVPAALCGVYGFRPTVGRYPGEGIVSLSPARDTAGPMARSMADVLLLDSVLAGREPVRERTGKPPALGLSPSHAVDLDPDVAQLYESTRRTLEGLGITFVTVDVDDIIQDARTIAATVLWGEARPALENYLAEHGGPSIEAILDRIASPDVRTIVDEGLDSVSKEEHEHSIRTLVALREEFGHRLSAAGVEALMFPTSPVVARPIGQDKEISLNNRSVPTFATFIRHSDLGGTLGLPGLSVPVGTGAATGLPVGMEFSSPAGTDDALLGLVAALAPHVAQVAAPGALPSKPSTF